MKWKGLTILQFLLLLTAIAIGASVAIPAYFSRPDVTLENAAVLLARDLRSVQNRSAYLGLPARLEFFPEGNGYRATDENGNVVHNPRTDLLFIRDYNRDAVFEGVSVNSLDLGEDRRVTYDGRGFATATGRITLVMGDAERTIVVEKRTGNISILGSTSGWQDLGF